MVRFEIGSSSFVHEGVIPSQYTCDGDDISPELTWQGAPEHTKSYALVVDDPDAPSGTFTHWIVFNIKAETKGLAPRISKSNELSTGGEQGVNDYGGIGYGGPCPPPGKAHRYMFRLYALDLYLDLKAGASKADLLIRIPGHILAEAEMIGTYQR